MLTDEERNSLKMLAYIRSGAFQGRYNCNECSEEDREERNCDCNDNHESIEYVEYLGELKACPLKYVATAHWKFIDEYDYYKKFPNSAPSYGECNARFWEAVKTYDNYEVEVMQLNRPDKGKKEFTALSALAKRLNK